MLKTAPDPQDVQDIQFKLHCKLKIFKNQNIEPFSKKCSLLTVASHYGLLFVGASQSVCVIRCDDLQQCSVKEGEKTDYYRRIVDFNGIVTHLSVNCDNSLLAVVIEVDKIPVAFFYDVKSFYSSQLLITNRLQLSATPGTTVLDIGWNPTNPQVFTACKSDGSLGVYTITKNIAIHELPPNAAATCFCWSPKGKQIAVGSHGKIIQHKPDLTPAKTINAPPLKGQSTIVALQWVSSFQFIAVYITTQEEEVSNNVLVIDAPKTGELSYTNYYDICYSSLSDRPTQFYMIFLSQWNMLMVASSNSTEVGVLHLDKDSWKQLTLMDAARAELPLGSDHSDTLPIGFALDTSATYPLPWGEGSIPPTPRLFILSHHGVLCCFNIVNLKEITATICKPPQRVDGALPSLFTKSHVENITDLGNKNLTNQQKEKEQPLRIPQVSKAQETKIEQPAQTKIEQPAQPSKTLSFNQQSTPLSFTSAKPPTFAQDQKFSFSNIQSSVPNQSSTGLPKMNALSFEAQLSKQPSMSHDIPKIIDTPIISVPQVPKPQAIFPQKAEVEPPAPTEAPTQDNSNIDDKELNDLLTQMIKEECIAIESELNALLHQARSLNVSVGTEDEKNKLTGLTSQLQEFLLEVVNNNTIQKSDVHLLKQNLIQTWAWLEEARSRHSAVNDSTITAILRAQPLDSAAEKQLLHIKHLMYYLDSQLKQAHGALDEQWENFQDYCRKTYRTQLPTMETVFRSMLKHNEILQKLTYKLKNISARINAHNHLRIKSSTLVDLDRLKKVEDHLKNLSIGPQDVFRMHYERILTKNKLMSPDKTCKLRNYLKHTEVKHVSSFKASIIKPPQLQTVKHIKSIEQKTQSVTNTQIEKTFKARAAPLNPLFEIDGTKESPQTLPLSKSHSFASAFVPTSNSAGLFEGSSTAFKAVPKSVSSFVKSAEATNAAVITPLTTASLFSNVSTKPLTHKNVPTSQMLVTSSPASFSFAAKNALFPPDQTPVKFDYQKPSTSDSPVVVVDASKLQTTSTSKTFSFNLPTSEVSISKTPLSLSTASTFGFPKDVPTTSVAPTTSTSLTFGKTCSSSLTTPSVTNPVSFPLGALDMTSKKDLERPLAVKEASISPVNLTNTAVQQVQAIQSPVSVKPSTQNSSLTMPAANLKSNESLFSSGKQSAVSITANNPEAAVEAKVLQNFSNLFEGSSVTISPVYNTSAGTASGTDTKSGSQVTLLKSLFATSTATNEGTTETIGAVTSATTKPVFGAPSSTAFQSSIFGSTAPSKSVFGLTNSQTATVVTTMPVTAITTSVTATVTTSSQDLKSTVPNPKVISSPGNVSNVMTKDPGVKTSPNQNLFSTNSISISTTVTAVTASQDLKTESITLTPVTQPSIFGNLTIKTCDANTVSVAPVSSTHQKVSSSVTQSSIFETKASDNANSQFSVFGNISSSGSIFGGTASVTTTTKSIFGNSGNTTVNAPSTSVTSATVSFGSSTVSSPPTVFGKTTPSAAQSFNSAAIATPSFGTSSVGTTFGSSAAQTTSSIFGLPASTTAASTPFSPSAVSAAPSVFGSAVSTTASVFGTAVTTAPSVFGTPVSSTSGIFGSTASTVSSSPFTSSTVSTAPSVFGSSSVSTANVQFGSSAPSVFANAPATSAPFGSAATSSTPAPFGATTGKSVFGNTSTAFAPTGSIFGAPNSSAATVSGTNTFGTQPSGFSSFGPATTTPSFQQPAFGSIFGTPASSAASAPVSSSAGTTSAFASLTPQFGTTSSSGSLFGTPTASTGSASFGFGSLNVSSTTSSNQFGTNVNPFAKSSSIFGNPSTQSPSVFGGSSVFGSTNQSSFGSQPSFGASPAFGQQSSFSQGTFGSPQPGPFSAGNNTVSQTGFGTPPAFQKPGGFGTPPAFGSSPAFGSAPSFGGAPTFGSSPTFGSPTKVFGNSPLSGSFQSATQENSTFANLANQNTVGFGSLAQQAQNSSSSPFSANSSFSSWR